MKCKTLRFWFIVPKLVSAECTTHPSFAKNSTVEYRTTTSHLPAAPRSHRRYQVGNDLVFSVGDKMFCATGLNQSPVSVSFKVSDDEFEEVCSQPGFVPAPYLARYKWVKLDDISKTSPSQIEQFIKTSYQLVKDRLPSKTKVKLGFQ